MTNPPRDNDARSFPVSVKGVIIRDGKVILLDEAVLSDEHKELRWFPLAEIDTLRMPQGYKASIRSWSARVQVAG